MWDFIKTCPQYFLPQHMLSGFMYSITRWRLPVWKNMIIRLFINHFDVDMQLAENPEAKSYASFNEFFTRSLKTEARPIDDTPSTIVSPVDGRVSQAGRINDDEIIQAKGKFFSLGALLANDETSVQHFQNGAFSTIYLSPRDYHRIHMPVDGRLLKMTYVPGDLFSVNESTSRVVDQLFARNERVICLFETEFGLMATILVGAIFVGGMETVWHGEITPARPRELLVRNYENSPAKQYEYSKGEEMGRFNMGSTVILLFGQDRMQWSEMHEAGATVRMGELIARGVSPDR